MRLVSDNLVTSMKGLVMFLPSAFQELLLSFSAVMTIPTLNNLAVLLAGWVLTPRRTVTGMLQAAGIADKRHHSAFHYVFASAKWSLDAVGLAVARLILAMLPAGATAFLALDDTLARKRGLKIFGVGMHHDPLLSSRNKAIVNWGHNWVVLGILLEFPFRPGHWFCLPVLFRLYRNTKTVAKEGGRKHTRPELARDLVKTLCEAFPERSFHLLADSAYCGKSVLRHLPENCDQTGRLHMDAALYDLPSGERNGTRGPVPKKGKRCPSPKQMLQKKGREIELAIYGRRERMRVVEGQAIWYGSAGNRPLSVVAVEPFSSGRKKQAFFSTRVDAVPEEMLVWYGRRWAIEVTFHDAKGYLGFEEPQGWSRKAVERTAPMAMLFYSLIVLWFARSGHKQVWFPPRPWYRQKAGICFADMVRTLRRQIIREKLVDLPREGGGTRVSLEPLIELAAWAA